VSLAAAFKEHELAATPRRECGVVVILKTLTDNDSAAVQEALDNPRLTGTSIARVLSDAGHPVSANTVNRHRRQDCSCGKGAA